MDANHGEELALRKKKKILAIHEKHNWKKLCGQKEAKLISTGQTYTMDDAPACQEFIQYNQETVNGNVIPLSDGHYYILFFIGEKQIPFTILRRQNYEAMKFYEEHIGDFFQIEVSDE